MDLYMDIAVSAVSFSFLFLTIPNIKLVVYAAAAQWLDILIELSITTPRSFSLCISLRSDLISLYLKLGFPVLMCITFHLPTLDFIWTSFATLLPTHLSL